MKIRITLVTEDVLSRAVAEKVIAQVGGNYSVDHILIWNKHKITEKIDGLNQSAKGQAFFVLTDQDSKTRCPPAALAELSVPLHQNLLYRFAVLEVESWLLADKKGLARFLNIPADKISSSPESISHPKEHLIQLSKQYSPGIIRRDIVPPANSTSRKGKNYNGTLIRFVNEHWNAHTAARSAPSLQRTLNRLQSFTPTANIP